MEMNLSKLRELVIDRVAWRAVVHGVTESQTRLCDWTELCLDYPREKEIYGYKKIHAMFTEVLFVIIF